MALSMVRTQQGMLRGLEKEQCSVFYSVPYAAPPVGQRRLRAPEPPEPYEGTRDATHPTVRPWMADQPPESACSREFYFDKQYWLDCSEDSLFVHIWTPAVSAEERLPVAVWIHGGAFQKGYGTEVETDGEGFCRRGVIFVSVEYRMGALGFLCHPWLAEEQGGRCGNYGILDQLAALRWVHENIAAFGGDPEKVTIIGQSAGAMSVQILSSSPLARGLFRGAVLQSAGGYCAPLTVGMTQAQAMQTGEQFLRACGVHSLEQLRALPARTLLELADEFQRSGQLSIAFPPVVDGVLLERGLDEIAEAGLHHDIAYLMGSNADDLCAQAMHEGMVAWSQNNIRLGRAPAYVYSFRRVPPGACEGVYGGSYHSAELWYVFETCARSWRPYTEADFELSARMADYWCSFVKTGNPNTPGRPCWKPCAGEEDVIALDVLA